MKKIKSYLLFTSWRYKLGMFLILPMAVLAAGLLWKYYLNMSGYSYTMVAVMVFFEILTDQGVFAGIQSKRGYKLDFLKTSPSGSKILCRGLVGDLIRSFFTAALCVGVCGAMGILTKGSGWDRCLGVLLAIYVAEVLALFISRFTRSVTLCVYTAYGGIVAGEILLTVVNVVSLPGLWLAEGLLALAAAAISVLVVRIAMKKWRQTFFDTQED